jgi:hypothetical protein
MLQRIPAHNSEVCQRFKRISCLRPLLREIFAFVFSEIVVLYAVPPRHEGRIAIVTTREAGCDGRDLSQRVLHVRTSDLGADGEIVWSWHPDADAKSLG